MGVYQSDHVQLQDWDAEFSSQRTTLKDFQRGSGPLQDVLALELGKHWLCNNGDGLVPHFIVSLLGIWRVVWV